MIPSPFIHVIMGASKSKNAMTVPLSEEGERYEELSEEGEGDVRVNVNSGEGGNGIKDVDLISRTKPRSFWRIIALLMLIFMAMLIGAIVNCAVDPDCGVIQTPSIGALLNDSDTSVLTVSSLVVLMGAHAATTMSTCHLVRNKAGVASVVIVISTLVLYVSVYISFILRNWYAAIAPVVISIAWAGCIMEGLRKFYKHRSRKRLYKVSLLFIILYSVSAALYIVFNSVPNLDFPGKDHAVFGVEMAMLATGATFVALLIPHGRWVMYIVQVKR